jgi:hypothetical protein
MENEMQSEEIKKTVRDIHVALQVLTTAARNGNKDATSEILHIAHEILNFLAGLKAVWEEPRTEKRGFFPDVP